MTHSQSAWLRKSRFLHGKGKARGREGILRIRGRPGLGMRASTVNICFLLDKSYYMPSSVSGQDEPKLAL